ncbi:MAG: hypothetical protein ACO1OF_16530 [Adhaeribacter sp.]
MTRFFRNKAAAEQQKQILINHARAKHRLKVDRRIDKIKALGEKLEAGNRNIFAQLFDKLDPAIAAAIRTKGIPKEIFVHAGLYEKFKALEKYGVPVAEHAELKPGTFFLSWEELEKEAVGA